MFISGCMSGSTSFITSSWEVQELREPREVLHDKHKLLAEGIARIGGSKNGIFTLKTYSYLTTFVIGCKTRRQMLPWEVRSSYRYLPNIGALHNRSAPIFRRSSQLPETLYIWNLPYQVNLLAYALQSRTARLFGRLRQSFTRSILIQQYQC